MSNPKLTDQERIEYISQNEHELTQLAILNRTEHGEGVLFLDLDDTEQVKNGTIKAMYFTVPFLSQAPQFADIVAVATHARAQSSVHFVYNNEAGKSLIIEKALT